MTLRVTLAGLHPGQIELEASTARYQVVVAGRRWGKTLWGVVRCYKYALRGKRIWWVAPTYSMGREGWRWATAMAWQIPGADVRQSDRAIVLPGGGMIEFKTADAPDRLRGAGLDGVMLDEFAYIREEVWTHSIRPALADRRGWASFISTPKGKANWAYDLFRSARRKQEGGQSWAVFTKPTADNPFIAPEELEEAREDLGDLLFAQEFGAEFVAEQGDYFRRDMFEIVTAAPAEAKRMRYWDMAATAEERGADPDWTVGVRLAVTPKGIIFVEDVVRFRKNPADTERHIAAIASQDGRRLPVRMEEEPGSSGKTAISHYRRMVLGGYDFDGVRSTGDKKMRARALSGQAGAGNVKVVEGSWNEVWLREMEAFPLGRHDDQVDATSGAYNSLVFGKRTARVAV